MDYILIIVIHREFAAQITGRKVFVSIVFDVGESK